ncbi:hypothetical protein RclHR1_10050002 [Rhizophagus clarus]|uniref:BTB/POZ protein n=1 Tax=Rhizophagus clarus TaxID=94130 RepID=A0A2Z6QCB9_9GLOM|nr:hypothetical protein RclHR1_10050002 [Rhizophagus clarus]GES81814.1 BTB/POZ protein [Rhizophagus clarus]
MAYEFFPELSQNFSQLLDDVYDCDVSIHVGESSNTKVFCAHSNILGARSPYFKNALSQISVIKKNDIYIFTKPHISPIIFEIIIRYMYTGILDLREYVASDILELLVVSNELLIGELITYVQKYLVENQAEWLQNNFVKIVHIAFQFESYKHLQDYCLESICEDPEPYINSPTLEKNILLGLLKRDDLPIDEIELWNYLIKWGIAQNSELNGKSFANLNCWDKRDFLILKNILDPFISHIRYFNISSEEFHSKIWPFRTVLPETLFEDIMSYYFADNQPENKLFPRNVKLPVDSIIIKSRHAAILTNWIQRQDIHERIPENNYNFNLIYRGSRDGFDNTTIRSKCNRQGACIVVIKIKENGTIIGGYNPLGWNHVRLCNNCGELCSYCRGYCNYCDGNCNGGYCDECGNICNKCIKQSGYCNNCGWRPYNNYNDNDIDCNDDYPPETMECFIFSLYNGKDLEKVKVSRVISNHCAIYESNIALNFGDGDLVINGNSGTCNHSNYESKILDINNFSIEEIEIFRFYQS